MVTEYTTWTVNKILDNPIIDTNKVWAMDLEDFVHPELYERLLSELYSTNFEWLDPEITGRRNYYIGHDKTHSEALTLARDCVYNNKDVTDAIANRFDLSKDVAVNTPLIWQDNNTNTINDIHVDHPSYYYTFQHCLAIDNEFAHTGTKFWEVECNYNDEIDKGMDPTFGIDSTEVKLAHQMPYVPNRAYILPRGSRSWHSCPDLTLEKNYMRRTMAYMVVTQQS